jgi:small subunit ribosomal protein S10e
MLHALLPVAAGAPREGGFGRGGGGGDKAGAPGAYQPQFGGGRGAPPS